MKMSEITYAIRQYTGVIQEKDNKSGNGKIHIPAANHDPAQANHFYAIREGFELNPGTSVDVIAIVSQYIDSLDSLKEVPEKCVINAIYGIKYNGRVIYELPVDNTGIEKHMIPQEASLFPEAKKHLENLQ